MNKNNLFVIKALMKFYNMNYQEALNYYKEAF